MRTALPAVLALSLACGGGGPAPAPPAAIPPPPGAPDPVPTPPSAAPSAALTIERLDASGECAGLVPDGAPEPVTLARAAPADATCGAALSDGTGQVAASARDAGGTSWQVFDPGGAPGRTFRARPLLTQPSGWLGLVQDDAAPGGPAVRVVALASDGAAAGAEAVSSDPALAVLRGASLAGDPSGGALALVADTAVAGNHWSALHAQRFDAAGAPRWAEPARFGARSESDVTFLVGGVSRGGEALAVWQRSAWVDVAWLDGAGGALAAGELVERSADLTGSGALRHELELVPLLDGALALRADGAFRRVYPRLATTSAPLPGWLAGRAGWSLRFTRGNAGYALLPPPGAAAADCAQAIELRAPSGRLCGRIWLRRPGAGACTTGAVDQGWDGTVSQQDAQGACSWRVWPRLLAR
ncbi:conserved hypothetical protein [Anaeromyxobacter sp. K]|uniref:hypothetical protein n=1 Tax=Anaeromyxobacter sp. (strain K) TaxID=447217 RepID=UPI00017BE392|nr:hypothetical protein [Anaeromyxobacter sp. K]ACG74331.1 conserved hypothetical protein [Anaeromyxobacter sp. K]